MGNFEQNPWAMTPKQELARGIKQQSLKQKAASTPHVTAETIEYNFSVAKSVFDSVDEKDAEPRRDEPTKQ